MTSYFVCLDRKERHSAVFFAFDDDYDGSDEADYRIMKKVRAIHEPLFIHTNSNCHPSLSQFAWLIPKKVELNIQVYHSWRLNINSVSPFFAHLLHLPTIAQPPCMTYIHSCCFHRFHCSISFIFLSFSLFVIPLTVCLVGCFTYLLDTRAMVWAE